uniref:Uncharacterized protein n=1 Tax=Anguilla anguilla TaxID=7936 RepID=A0A0E9SKY6_ANGAN
MLRFPFFLAFCSVALYLLLQTLSRLPAPLCVCSSCASAYLGNRRDRVYCVLT